MRLLRPTRQRRCARRRESIPAARDTEEPAVDVAQQNLGRIGNRAFDLGCAPWAAGQRSRAGERLLAVGGHDRRPANAAGNRITQTPPVLVEQANSTPRIHARAPTPKSYLHLDACGWPD